MSKPSCRLWLVLGGLILCALVVISIVLAVVLNDEDDDGLATSVILSQVPLIDGHNDVANNIKDILNNKINDFSFNGDDPKWNCSACMTDLKRLRAGGVGGQFWAAYVPCSTQYDDAVEQTLEQIDDIKRLIKKYPADLELVTTANGIWEAFERKKIASLIAVEGGHSIDSRLAVLRQMYDLGVRYLTLSHACNTPWVDASPVDDVNNASAIAENNGLSNFGQAVVYEMNRLGMMVDLSHVSYKTMQDAINISIAPVIFSHSSAYSLCNHHRNVRDDILQKMGGNGGIVMVNFYPDFVQCNSSKEATLEDVIAHVNYIRLVAGVDHIGIGADYDGVTRMPIGLEDVSKYPDLFERLRKSKPNEPHWSTSDLKKLAGLNLIRVFKEVEKVRDSMSNQLPYENQGPTNSKKQQNND